VMPRIDATKELKGPRNTRNLVPNPPKLASIIAAIAERQILRLKLF
jgi:hypothetical protein